MSAARKFKPRITSAEYLELERAAQYKSEFYQGEMIEMVGASLIHNRVKDNLVRAFGNRLSNGPCQEFSSDAKIYVDRTGSYFYPVVVVVCGKPEVQDGKGDVLLNPVVVVEILSPSTESFDRGMKFLHYQRVPSLREYLIVSQDQPLVQRYVRHDDNSWLLNSFEGLEVTLELKSIPVSIPMADVYGRIEFGPDGQELK